MSIRHTCSTTWFSKVGHETFATRPLTENGLIRFVGHPRYPNSPGPPGVVLFWSDDLGIADRSFFAAELLTSHARVTDSYLLVLPHAHGGRLATMDRKLASEVVPGGRNALEMIPT